MSNVRKLQSLEYQRGYADAKKIYERKGKWKTAYLDHVSMGIRPKVLYCSECDQCIAYPTNFCPNCGADMRGVKDDS